MSPSARLFDYDLPQDRIAQTPIEPRDHSRLMILNRQTGAICHRRFYEIGEELREGDLLVFNDTKVFKARLHGQVRERKIEVFLLRESDGLWKTLINPGKKVKTGDRIQIGNTEAEVVEKQPDGTVLLRFFLTAKEVLALTDTYGEIPVPPYIKQVPDELNVYQTVYARETGSVAAPTAGFHFTKRLMEELKGRGVQFAFVTLHVGIGTFRPMKTETVEEHKMHAESVSLSPETARQINQAKEEGRRVIAVGTTTVRTLEGVARLNTVPTLLPESGFQGDVDLFITPGFPFLLIDGLITNFHLPRSTLLVLVSAFAGRDRVLSAYGEAVKEGYRFYSFGDGMFLR
ncbi:MAG TPA: tRNA preQ1(34) S-adenosylmethionine ribosyltransferase-isomerase QueA [Patescibacteria group bacterium]|nr:tRNA preQ1(34) S-adenosylmethionine ribosyltransferase-isomerase QueA [Patescibacteria group bacterium]